MHWPYSLLWNFSLRRCNMMIHILEITLLLQFLMLNVRVKPFFLLHIVNSVLRQFLLYFTLYLPLLSLSSQNTCNLISQTTRWKYILVSNCYPLLQFSIEYSGSSCVPWYFQVLNTKIIHTISHDCCVQEFMSFTYATNIVF